MVPQTWCTVRIQYPKGIQVAIAHVNEITVSNDMTTVKTCQVRLTVDSGGLGIGSLSQISVARVQADRLNHYYIHIAIFPLIYCIIHVIMFSFIYYIIHTIIFSLIY